MLRQFYCALIVDLDWRSRMCRLYITLLTILIVLSISLIIPPTVHAFVTGTYSGGNFTVTVDANGIVSNIYVNATVSCIGRETTSDSTSTVYNGSTYIDANIPVSSMSVNSASQFVGSNQVLSSKTESAVMSVNGITSTQDGQYFITLTYKATYSENVQVLKYIRYCNGSKTDTVTLAHSSLINDTSSPVISSFNVPAISSTLTVPITSFTATDTPSYGKLYYLVNETATTPSLNTGWSTIAPASYTFTSYGSKKLYAWAKDYKGNITGTSAAVNVNVLNVTKTGTGSGTVTSSPNGINCGTACSSSFQDSSVTLTASPASNSIFLGWTGCDTVRNTTECLVSVTAARNVAAKFDLTPGVCGSSDKLTLDTAPKDNLCASGTTASAVTGTGPWSWTCTGSNGGTIAPCTTYIQVYDGKCGSADRVYATSAPTTGLCSGGSPTAVAGAGPWNWSCQGKNGGINATCTTYLKVVDGVCGKVDGSFTSGAPVSDLCSNGIATAVTGDGPWSWTCQGNSIGKTVTCGSRPAYSGWQQLNNMPFAGNISAFVPDPVDSQVVYAGTSGGVYKSIDGGVNWLETPILTAPNVLSVAVDKTDNSVLYAMVGDGLYKTTDGGGSWVFLNSGKYCYEHASLTISPNNNQVLYVGYNTCGVYKSVDGGVSWTQINNGLPLTLPSTDSYTYINTVNSLVIDPSDDQTLYAGTYNGIYKTVDGGATWNAVNIGVQSTNNTSKIISFISIDPINTQTLFAGSSYSSGMFKSIDGGATWTAITNPFNSSSSLLVSPADSKKLFLASPNGIATSSDGGSTWTKMVSYSQYFTKNYYLAISPLNPQIVFYWGPAGIYKLDNGGNSWSATNYGSLKSLVITSIAIDPTNAKVLYAGTDSIGLLKSTDSGSSWLTVAPYSGEPIIAIAIDPVTSQNVFYEAAGGPLYRFSYNSWLGVDNYIATSSFAIDSVTGQTIYSGTYGDGVHKSTDGGKTWTIVKNGLPSNPSILALHIDPANSDVVYAGIYPGIYKTTDGGKNWSISNNGISNGTINSITSSKLSNNIVYAGGGLGVYKSLDSGSSWTKVTNNLYSVKALIIDPNDSQTVYALSSGIYKTTDGGVTWTEIDFGITNKNINAIALDPQHSQVIYAGTQGSGIYRAVDGGNSSALANGLCGTANNQTFTIAPTTNLCTTGTASAITGTGIYSWTCAGSNGGDNANCKAYSPTFVNGLCGTANNQTFAIAPITNLCTTGLVSTNGTDPWSWTCAGIDGGFSSNCLAYSSTSQQVMVLAQNFNSAATPSLPTGWQSSGNAVWYTNTGTMHPSDASAHSASNLVYFNSYTASAGLTANLISPAFSLANTTGGKVSLWIYRDSNSTYITNADLVNVYVNTTTSITGATLLGTVNRSTTLSPTVAATGWYQYSFDIPSTYNSTSNYLIINGVSAYGNDIHLDDITVTAIANGTKVNGQCGSAYGINVTTAPSGSSLCSIGTASSVTGSGPWNWTCAGSYGGTAASCSTSIQTWAINSGTVANGTVSCTSPVNQGASSTCTVTPSTGYQLSTFTDNSVDKKSSVASNSYSITNVAANHTIAATFTLIPVNGSCGNSDGKTLSVAPTAAFLCSTGTASTVTGSGPWNWTCAGSNGGTTASCSASLLPVTPAAVSKSKVFLSGTTPEAFTIANSEVNIYGGSNREVITINSGVTNISLDQNIDRINLPGTTSDFIFKQSGNLLVVYNAADTTGTTPVVTLPTQGDSDGTQIGFSNGTIYDVKFNAGQILLGGALVNSSTPALLWPLTATATVEPTLSATSSAKVFMASNDSFTVANSGVTVYGSSGSEVLTITSGATNITFDQNIEQVIFAGTSSNYTFQQSGNQINIYNATGTTLIAKGPVQDDSDGTLLTFTNGTGSAKMAAGGAMQLGGSTVSTTTPAAITSSVFASEIIVNVSAAGSDNASSGSKTYNITPGAYTYTISNFASGDKLNCLGTQVSVTNNVSADGTILVSCTGNNLTVQINLTGISTTLDAQVYNQSSFNSVFGAGSLTP